MAPRAASGSQTNHRGTETQRQHREEQFFSLCFPLCLCASVVCLVPRSIGMARQRVVSYNPGHAKVQVQRRDQPVQGLDRCAFVPIKKRNCPRCCPPVPAFLSFTVPHSPVPAQQPSGRDVLMTNWISWLG